MDDMRMLSPGPFSQEAQTTKRPKSSRLRALHFLVAGGRYDTVCDLPVLLRLPVVGQVALRAA